MRRNVKLTMVSRLKISKLVLTVLLLTLTVSGYQIDLDGGNIEQKDLASQQASQNWIGISGDVNRFGDGILDQKVGQLTFDSSQTGEVIDTDLKGLSGGGFYFAFAPYNQKVEVSNISSPEPGDLQKNGIFGEEDFPAFYPDYANITDTPDETFTQSETVMLENQHINLSKAVLSSGVTLYLGKFTRNGSELPVFIAPIDGLQYNGERYQSCHDGGKCSQEFILPTYVHEDNAYSINFLSSGKPISGCGEIDYNGSTYVEDGALSSSTASCLNLTSQDLMVDMLHQSVSGSGKCGVRMNDDRQYLRGAEISGFENGVCASDSSSSEIMKAEIDAETAVNTSDSDLEIWDLNSLGNLMVSSRNASVNMDTFRVGSVEVAGMYRNLDVAPASISQQVTGQTELKPLNLSIQASDQGNGSAENIGFYYPPVNDTGVEPTDIMHIKQVNGSFEVEQMENVKVDLSSERLIFSETEVSDFSYFAVFGEEVEEKEVVREEEVVEEVVEERVVEETVVPPPPPPAQSPEPIMLDLNATEENVTVTKGGVAEIGFEVENYGDISSGQFFVGATLPEGWSIVSEPVDPISPGDSAEVQVLVETSEEIEVGRYTHNFQAFRNRSTFDIAPVDMVVQPSETDISLDILSGPSYLTPRTGEEHTIGILVRNSGPVDIENAELGFRNLEECGQFDSDSYQVEGGGQETFRFDYRAADQALTCTGALTVKEGNRTLAFHPMKIDVSGAPDRSSPVVLPLILFAWTIITVYEVLM